MRKPNGQSRKQVKKDIQLLTTIKHLEQKVAPTANLGLDEEPFPSYY